MPPLTLSPTFTASVAALHAAKNLHANHLALRLTQQWLERRLDADIDGLEWIYARDGALTALDASTGQWWAGCSVPQAASETLLRTLDVRGTVACFLAPFHAAAIRVVLERLKVEQGLICILPDERALSIVLHCDDFANEIARHRLWIAGGERWAQDLDRILADRPGLPVPSQFVRLSDGAEQQAEALVPEAQRIFTDHATRRSSRITMLARERRLTPRWPACVLAPSGFRLWDDGGFILAQLAGELHLPILDADDPAQASPLSLAERAGDCGAVVTVNRWRQERSGAVPMDVPWIAWLTVPRIPPIQSAGPRDRLLLADPNWAPLATAQGWSTDRLVIAGFPTMSVDRAASDETSAVLLFDLPDLDPPLHVVDLSSQRLLWDFIRDELLADPFRVGGDVATYLRTRMERGGIAPGALDAGAFIDQLIVPAFARGLAQMLVRENVPLQLYGRGWDRVESLQPHVAGPVTTRDQFTSAIARSRVLIHPFPARDAHPIDACPRPVLRALGTRQQFFHDLRQSMRQPCEGPRRTAPALSPQLLESLLT